MASQVPPSSGFPASMGPGARPAQPGDVSNPGDFLRQLQVIRSHYYINADESALHIGYALGDQKRQYDIPFDAIPMSNSTRSLLFGGPRRAQVSGSFLIDMVRGAENMTGRPLEQREVEGFAMHAGKRTMYSFFGVFGGFTLGYGVAAAGWKTMKFPFMKAKPMERYDNFPNRYLPVIKGQYARIMWQITRANIYAAIGLIFVQSITSSMGESVMAVGLYRDSRTQELVKSMKSGFDRLRMNRGSYGGTNNPGAQPLPQTTSDGDQGSQDFYGKDASLSNSQEFYGRPSSGGSNYTGGDSTFTDSTTDTGMLSDSAMRQREAKQPSPSSSGTSRSRPSRSYREPDQSRDSGSFFDDASPTAGHDPDPGFSQPSSQSAGRGGSAWDRYRRGGGSDNSNNNSFQSPSQNYEPSQPQPMQQTGGWRRQSDRDFETRGDSFSFSSGEEEKRLAKQQAQRDFDAMLDNERRESGSGEYDSDARAAQVGAESSQQQNSSGSGSAWSRYRK